MFKEEEIRPIKEEKLADILRIQDIKKFFLDKDGNLLKTCFNNVCCPACGKENSSLEFVKDKFSFVRCNFCNTLYVNPRPNREKLLEYYKNSESINYFVKEILEKTEETRKNLIFKPRAKRVIDWINSLNVSKNVIIEIGGGNGLFLEIIRDMNLGFNRYINIEPSSSGAELTKRRGIEVIQDFFENVEGIKANCICAFELIEHLYDPFYSIKKCYSLLEDNGLLIMTMPNIEGFDLMLLGKDSDNIAAPNHLNYFNPDSIRILLERCSFKVVSIETPGLLDVNIVKNKVKKGYLLNDRFISFLLSKPQKVLDEFQIFLQKAHLSSHMFVVCSK